MRVCVIGNSHAGPLAQAFRADPSTATLPWTFHSVPNGYAQGKGLRALKADMEKGHLTGLPGREGPALPLVARAHDAFVLVGGQPSPFQHRALWAEHFSSAFREAGLAALYRGCLNHHVLQELRRITDAPVWCTCSYLPSFPDGGPDPAQTARSARHMAAFWAGLGVTFLDQPDDLRDSAGWTPASARISDQNPHLHPEAAAHQLVQIRSALGV